MVGVVSPLFHSYWKGAVPPLTSAVVLPSCPDAQVTAVVLKLMASFPGSASTTVSDERVILLKSVTCTRYLPAGRPVMILSVCGIAVRLPFTTLNHWYL